MAPAVLLASSASTTAALLFFFILGAVAADEYDVGDSSGWNAGVDYATWASQHSFKQGDSLKFTYNGGVHSVATVSEADFKSCNAANAIALSTSGSSIVRLDEEGAYYFICGNAMHCQGGMRLRVEVGSTAPKSSSSSDPSRSAAPATSLSSSAAPATPSSSSSPSPMVSFATLLVACACLAWQLVKPSSLSLGSMV